MAYGFEVYNDNGDLLVNDKTSNLALVESGTCTSAGGIGGGVINYANLGYGPPIIYVQTPDSLKYVHLNSITATQAQLTFYDDEAFLGIRNLSAGTCNYRIYVPFKYAPPVSGNSYGMRVYAANGDTLFDSTRAVPLAVAVAVVSAPARNATDPTQYTMPTGIGSRPWFDLTGLKGAAGYAVFPSKHEELAARTRSGLLEMANGARSTGGSEPEATYKPSQSFFILKD